MAIDALQKPQGAWCAHCKVGGGCTIYDARPDACRKFACQWLLDPNLPDHLRPDRSKVVLMVDNDGRRLIARCDPTSPTAWRREPIYGALKQWARASFGTGRQVMAAAGRRLWIIAPAQDLDLGEVDPASSIAFTELADGMVKATVHPPGTH